MKKIVVLCEDCGKTIESYNVPTGEGTEYVHDLCDYCSHKREKQEKKEAPGQGQK